MDAGAQKPIVNPDDQIKALEKSMSWARATDKNVKKVSEQVGDLVGALSGPGVTDAMKRKVWTALKDVEAWSSRGKAIRAFRGIKHAVIGAPKEDKRAVLNNFVKEQKERFENEIAPADPVKFDRLFKNLTQMQTGSIVDKKEKKSWDTFLRSLPVPSPKQDAEAKPTMAYKHGSTASKTAFFDAMEKQDVRGVKLLLLDGVCRGGPKLEKALETAMAHMNRLSDTDPPDLEAIEKSWEIIEALVEAGAPLNTPAITSGPRGHRPDSLLQLATYSGRPKLVKTLLDLKAPWALKYKNAQGKTVPELPDIIVQEKYKPELLRGDKADMAKSVLMVIERAEIERSESGMKSNLQVRGKTDLVDSVQALLGDLSLVYEYPILLAFAENKDSLKQLINVSRSDTY